jgi:predicted lysophospholipase L1 biosynthesis ABC-type transport system permease subunit
MPPVLTGRTINTLKGNEAVVEERFLTRFGVKVGDDITIKTIQGTKEKFFSIRVVGSTDGQQYQFAQRCLCHLKPGTRFDLKLKRQKLQVN